MGEALAGSDRPLLITSGVGMGSPGRGQPAVEDVFDWSNPNPRIALRAGRRGGGAARGLGRGRAPAAGARHRQAGADLALLEIARAKGAVGLCRRGRQPLAGRACHRRRAAYRLALERHEAGARYHAVAEEGVTVRDIAEVVGAGLGVPVDHSPSERRRRISAGWRRSPAWTCRHPAPGRASGSAGRRPARA